MTRNRFFDAFQQSIRFVEELIFLTKRYGRLSVDVENSVSGSF